MPSRHASLLRTLALACTVASLIPLAASAQVFINAPTTITQSGLHVLTNDIVVPNCFRVIEIEADYVTLDLNGFAIRCPNGVPDSRLISMEEQVGIRIRGGLLDGGEYGIYYHVGEASMALDVRNMRARHFSLWGIYVGGSPGRRPLDTVILRDNHVSGQTNGVFLRRAGGQVRDNVIESGLGMYLLDTQGLLVADNRVRSENHSVLVSGVSHSIFRDNTLRSIGTFGFELLNASSNLFRDNLVTAGSRGINLDSNSHGNAFDWNRLGESPVGIHIEPGATDNLLSNNRSIVGGPTVGSLGGPGSWHDAGGNSAH